MRTYKTHEHIYIYAYRYRLATRSSLTHDRSDRTYKSQCSSLTIPYHFTRSDVQISRFIGHFSSASIQQAPDSSRRSERVYNAFQKLGSFIPRPLSSPMYGIHSVPSPTLSLIWLISMSVYVMRLRSNFTTCAGIQ